MSGVAECHASPPAAAPPPSQATKKIDCLVQHENALDRLRREQLRARGTEDDDDAGGTGRVATTFSAMLLQAAAAVLCCDVLC
jgi:hypothetical protein